MWEVVGQMIHLSRETPTGEAEDDEHQRDRGEDSRTRPSQRSSQLTGGVRTNVSSTASAMGTSTACAQ